MNILLFGGTSEGRDLARWLISKGLKVTVSVATEYGAHFVPIDENIEIVIGRLDVEKMKELMSSKNFSLIIDATHPYAVEVTENIKSAAQSAGIKLIRIYREEEVHGIWTHASSAEKAAEVLRDKEGNILLTTGSKDLEAFAEDGLRDRCYPRVLPSMESLKKCLELGFLRENIICMQGPFSKELNAAIIRQFNIKILVTKSSGKAGGFEEKSEAAKETCCDMIVIDRQVDEVGLTVDEAKKTISTFI